MQQQKRLKASPRWLLFPVLLFVITIALQERGTYSRANDWLTDVRTDRTPLSASGDVGVIAIDPASLDDIGTWPWSRAVHADILDRLIELGAGTVLYDVNFAYPSDPAGDAAFADALDRAGGATLLATFSQYGLNGEIIFSQPHAPFEERSWPAMVTVTPTDSGQIRHYPTGATIDGFYVPSAAVQIAGAYANSTQSFTINYGISPRTVPVFSVSDLLSGKLTSEDIAGRAFLIGAAAAELGDHFAVPLHQVVPGVLIHAVAAETLLQDAAIKVIPPIWLLPPLFILLCALHLVGRHNAWRLVSFAFLAGIGVEGVALAAYRADFTTLPTAMIHPALIMLAIGRLAKSVDLSRILIRRQEVQMENAERLREHIFQHSSDGFIAINGEGEIVFQSDVAKSLLGSGTLPPALYTTARHILENPDAKPLLDHLELETQTETKSLELHANASQLQTLDKDLNRAQEPLALITLRDVTDLKRKQKQIEYLSRHDDRTTALRRHSFCDAIEARRNEGEEFAVAAIALRRLTAINATLGRDIGDQVLAKAVQRLRAPEMALGEVARLEGNVLGVIIPNLHADTVLPEAMSRIRDALTRPYSLAGTQAQIGVSIGYLPSDPALAWNGEAHLSRAQDALARSMESAAYVSSAYDSADSDRRARSRRLEHALGRALERNEFHLLYQPQYRLSDQTLIGAEALIRWQSAEFGAVSPVEFIPIAESSGFITTLGQFVLEQTIKDATTLPDHVIISPNVSAFQLLQPDFPALVTTLLDRHDLSAHRLCLELTESEFLSPDSEAAQRMRALRASGISWALDDFGTGYSSLSYLSDLPFDKVKLDRAFLKDIFEGEQAQTALRSLVQLVQGYGKSLLCEGAETEAEIALLTRMGCDSVQGYYFGRPVPLDAFIGEHLWKSAV